MTQPYRNIFIHALTRFNLLLVNPSCYQRICFISKGRISY